MHHRIRGTGSDHPLFCLYYAIGSVAFLGIFQLNSSRVQRFPKMQRIIVPQGSCVDLLACGECAMSNSSSLLVPVVSETFKVPPTNNFRVAGAKLGLISPKKSFASDSIWAAKPQDRKSSRPGCQGLHRIRGYGSSLYSSISNLERLWIYIRFQINLSAPGT